jgi:hypothetical protein
MTIVPPLGPAPVIDLRIELWLGALLLAGGARIDPFPAAFAELAEAYFRLHPPTAKA